MNKKALFIIPVLLMATAFSAFSLNMFGTQADYRLGLTYDAKTLITYLGGTRPSSNDPHNIMLSNQLLFHLKNVENQRLRMGPRADFELSIRQSGSISGSLNAAFTAEYTPMSASLGITAMLFDSKKILTHHVSVFFELTGSFFFDKTTYRGFGITLSASVLPVKIYIPGSSPAYAAAFQDIHVNVGIVYVF